MTCSGINPPNQGDTRDRVRQDYVAGVSTAVIAERYGLTDRTVRRWAARHGWQRTPRPRLQVRQERLESELEAFPELSDVIDVNGQDTHDLLFLPDATKLCRFAFRRAAEAAAMDSPNEAAAWMRLVHLTDRVAARIDVDVRPFSRADYMRAGILRSMAEHLEEEPLDLGTESEMSGMSAENHGGPDSHG